MSNNRILSTASPLSSEPGTVLLRTERLIIRRYRLDDAAALSAAGNYEAVARNMTDRFPSPYTVEDARYFIANFAPKWPEQYPFHAGVFLRVRKGGQDGTAASEDGEGEEGALIGGIGLESQQDVRYRTWELGYYFTPSSWGQGYATEAVSALVRWTFRTWPGLNRIEATAYGHNRASGRVLEKSGFVREGLKRGCVLKMGVVRDEVMYGIIRSDLDKEGQAA